MSDQWCLIESDPGVLSELMEKLGCDGVQARDSFSALRQTDLRREKAHGFSFGPPYVHVLDKLRHLPTRRSSAPADTEFSRCARLSGRAGGGAVRSVTRRAGPISVCVKSLNIYSVMMFRDITSFEGLRWSNRAPHPVVADHIRSYSKCA
jgi:hypothetical protein